MTEKKPFIRSIRSFVKREGKLTKGQQNAIDTQWSQFGVDYTEQALNFSDLFSNSSPVVLEIGFGNGLSLADMAKAQPEINFFGIEVHTPGVGSLLVQVKKQELQNVRISNEDAVQVIKNQIPNNSLKKVQIFFPDPWHKKRHHKRRLIQTEFVTLLTQKLQLGGCIHVATDWENYAEHILQVLNSQPSLVNLSDTNQYVSKPDYRPQTKYESRGLNLGHGVWDMLFEKR